MIAALAVRPWDGTCPGCGVVLPVHEGPLHAYLGASAECWQLYGRLASPSTTEPDAPRLRRLVADAYAAQHPGVPQRRSIQSVAVHLMDLCLLLERDGEIERDAPEPGREPRRKALDLHWLDPPDARGEMTVADALRASAGESRAGRIEAWASEVWAAWAAHHPTVRAWLDACARGAGQPSGQAQR